MGRRSNTGGFKFWLEVKTVARRSLRRADLAHPVDLPANAFLQNLEDRCKDIRFSEFMEH